MNRYLISYYFRLDYIIFYYNLPNSYIIYYRHLYSDNKEARTHYLYFICMDVDAPQKLVQLLNCSIQLVFYCCSVLIGVRVNTGVLVRWGALLLSISEVRLGNYYWIVSEMRGGGITTGVLVR